MFSIAHSYEQNGDLLKDPDMVFIRGQDGEYYPIELQEDNPAFYQFASVGVSPWRNGSSGR